MRQTVTEEERERLVGRRVVVRRRLHGEDYYATDVLGTLEAWADGILSVRRDRQQGAQAVDIPEDDLIAIKAVPARPVSIRDIRDLETAAESGWQALEKHHTGGWLLRAAGGFTRRANSCLPLNDPGVPLHEAIDEVQRWYAERELPPTFQLPSRMAKALEHMLDTRGWSRSEDVLVLTAVVDDVRRGTRDHLPSVRIDTRPDDAWLACYHYRGTTLPPHAVDVLTNADQVGFASVDEGGQRLAIARGAVSNAASGRRWLGLTAVEVVPDARRRGLGSHVVAALADWAGQLGAEDVYLQVEEANTAAQATYRKLGFGDHHTYYYRRAT